MIFCWLSIKQSVIEISGSAFLMSGKKPYFYAVFLLFSIDYASRLYKHLIRR